jgi:6-phosphogluconolactonase
MMIRFFTIIFLAVVIQADLHAQKVKEIIYVGTYSTRGSEGLYVFQLDRVKGKLNPIQIVTTPLSPTFLAIHPSGKFLYSVNRGSIDEMKNSG